MQQKTAKNDIMLCIDLRNDLESLSITNEENESSTSSTIVPGMHEISAMTEHMMLKEYLNKLKKYIERILLYVGEI